ncbi:hypothetical protein [Nostoc sp.]|uniref:hypothetical protein n=1 Tax=Nostoc sp. TaxID=1180 RepID=UPI002FF7534C
MSLITIQCRLVADKASLRHLWKLMAEKNTPLINELLEHIIFLTASDSNSNAFHTNATKLRNKTRQIHLVNQN